MGGTLQFRNILSESVGLCPLHIRQNKKAYSLPMRDVAPGEHVLIYCDKEGNGYHASFRLESGKDGAVYLFKNGEITDRITGMKSNLHQTLHTAARPTDPMNGVIRPILLRDPQTAGPSAMTFSALRYFPHRAKFIPLTYQWRLS